MHLDNNWCKTLVIKKSLSGIQFNFRSANFERVTVIQNTHKSYLWTTIAFTWHNFLHQNGKCLRLRRCCHRNTKTVVLSNRRTQAGYFNWISKWTLLLIITGNYAFIDFKQAKVKVTYCLRKRTRLLWVHVYKFWRPLIVAAIIMSLSSSSILIVKHIYIYIYFCKLRKVRLQTFGRCKIPTHDKFPRHLQRTNKLSPTSS